MKRFNFKQLAGIFIFLFFLKNSIAQDAFTSSSPTCEEGYGGSISIQIDLEESHFPLPFEIYLQNSDNGESFYFTMNTLLQSFSGLSLG